MRIVGGRFGGRTLASPKPGIGAIRPTSDRLRESLFNVLAHGHGDAADAARVLDLFAGTGTTGAVADALGRHAVLVDDNPEAIEVMRRRMPAATLR